MVIMMNNIKSDKSKSDKSKFNNFKKSIAIFAISMMFMGMIGAVNATPTIISWNNNK